MSDQFGPIIDGSIRRLIDATNKSSSAMTRLTYVALILAAVQAGAAIIQVWLAFR
ncbi:hypothetical protein JCM15764A_16470 [Geotalea toluenoxydans]